MSETAVTAFLGDRDRVFDLLPKLDELERIVGAGTGAIVKRIVAGDFHALDCPSVVRLALIGAGETPKEAAALTAEYVTARPLAEGHELASLIVMAAWAGTKKPAPAKVEPAPAPEHDLVLVHADGRREAVQDDGSLEVIS